MKKELRIYSQIPGPKALNENITFKEFVIKIARLSEGFNFDGSLIFFNYKMYDPWSIASIVLENTEKLTPLVAVQPNTINPFMLGKIVQSLSNLYNRRIDLNMITGNSAIELSQINDRLNHQERYDRLVEYIKILKMIFSKKHEEVSFSGNYYNYKSLVMEPKLQNKNYPMFFVPGASSTSIAISKKYADVALTRPQPIEVFKKEYSTKFNDSDTNLGIRIGIIARALSKEAWSVARNLFGVTKEGKERSKSEIKNGKTISNLIMAKTANDKELYDDIYWMGAYLSGNNNNPYLVGSYERCLST